MFDRPGIDTTEVAWITRDQFVYYLEMTHALTDPTDWSTLRDELLRALAAAFGLEPPREPARPDGHRSEVGDAVPQLFDEIRQSTTPSRTGTPSGKPSGTAPSAASTHPDDTPSRRGALRMYGLMVV